MKLFIKDMTCGGCAGRVTAAIKSVDDKAEVNIHLADKIVDVETVKDLEPILAVLDAKGYPAVQR